MDDAAIKRMFTANYSKLKFYTEKLNAILEKLDEAEPTDFLAAVSTLRLLAKLDELSPIIEYLSTKRRGD